MSKVTEIICIIDRSGSMMNIREDAIGGFNTFLEEQKKVEGKANITVVLFDHEYNVVADRVDVNEFEGLNYENFQPRGMTALLDAIGITISKVSEKNDKDRDYVVAILTDGAENCSKEFNREGVFKMISEKTEEGWQFLYLGANQDAIGEATKLGINGSFAGNFVAKGNGASTAMLHASEMILSYRTVGEMTSYDDVAKKVIDSLNRKEEKSNGEKDSSN